MHIIWKFSFSLLLLISHSLVITLLYSCFYLSAHSEHKAVKEVSCNGNASKESWKTWANAVKWFINNTPKKRFSYGCIPKPWLIKVNQMLFEKKTAKPNVVLNAESNKRLFPSNPNELTSFAIFCRFRVTFGCFKCLHGKGTHTKQKLSNRFEFLVWNIDFFSYIAVACLSI